MLLASALTIPAAARGDGGNTGTKSPGKVRFDPATVVTVSGTLLGEQRAANSRGETVVRLVLKVGEDRVSVHLGPESWVNRQKMRFEKGDELTVRGSRFTYSGKYGLIAQTVTRSGETLVVLDAAGNPVWAARPKP